MSEIYIITSGEYSGYGIDCAFTDKELALLALQDLNKKWPSQGYEIEVYEANQPEKNLIERIS